MFQLLNKVKVICIAIIPYYLSRVIALFIPVDENKFFFLSMGGTNYGDSMKSLSDYISEHREGARQVWAFDKNHYKKIKCPFTKVKLYSIKYYYHQLTSKYFITNQGCGCMDFRKRKGQVKIQTWHGTALKRLGRDVKSQDWPRWLLRFKPKAMKYELRDTDIFISGSAFMTNLYKNAYDYPRVIFETGTPRNDIFFQKSIETIKKVHDFFDIPMNMGIILYAPTFRNNGDMSCYDVDVKVIKDYLSQSSGREYVCLIRLHPIMMSEIGNDSIFIKGAIDANFYPDMQELLYVADVLITDYSSTMFDFMYSYKPVILYVKDRDTYNRGFYFNIDELPFIIINHNDEIWRALSEFDEMKYRREIDAFLKKIGSVEDGNATSRVYNLMISF